MRFILATGLKDSYESFVSPEQDIVRIVFSIVMHHLRKIVKESTAGQQLVTISSRISTSTMCPAIAMEK